MVKEPLPCPFCGGRPRITKEFHPECYLMKHTCKRFSPQFNIFSGGFSSRSDALDAWNRRIPHDPRD